MLPAFVANLGLQSSAVLKRNTREPQQLGSQQQPPTPEHNELLYFLHEVLRSPDPAANSALAPSNNSHPVMLFDIIYTWVRRSLRHPGHFLQEGIISSSCMRAGKYLSGLFIVKDKDVKNERKRVTREQKLRELFCSIWLRAASH